jgi:hypothetical protein
MTDPAPTNRWAFLRVHGFLVFLLCLVAANVAILVVFGGYSFTEYLNLMLALTMLFQHLAMRYARPGLPRRAMQALAFAWLAATLAFIIFEWTPPLMR